MAAVRGVGEAPGRVNLIGEHTDYNGGFVLPFAIPQAAWLAAAPRADGRWRFLSLDLDSTVKSGEVVPGEHGWQAYLAGVVWALRQAGHQVGGADLVLSSSVLAGAGLSSSVAIKCVVMVALCDLCGLDIKSMDRARPCQVAENSYVGASTGLMD